MTLLHQDRNCSRTHRLGFPGRDARLQNLPGVFPGGSTAAGVPGQILSTAGQNLTVVQTHLNSFRHFSVPLDHAVSPDALPASLYAFTVWIQLWCTQQQQQLN